MVFFLQGVGTGLHIQPTEIPVYGRLNTLLFLMTVELNLTGVRWFFGPPKTSIFEAFNHLK